MFWKVIDIFCIYMTCLCLQIVIFLEKAQLHAKDLGKYLLWYCFGQVRDFPCYLGRAMPSLAPPQMRLGFNTPMKDLSRKSDLPKQIPSTNVSNKGRKGNITNKYYSSVPNVADTATSNTESSNRLNSSFKTW